MKILINPPEIKSVVSMSASVPRLTKLAFDPEVSVNDIARVIEFDQVLTANVLHWANSSWSASQTPVVSVKDAVVRFGIGHIVKLVIGKCVAKPMKQAFPGYELQENELWHHSVACALAVECLEKITSKHVPAPAFTAALVHDIGKLLLERHISPDLLGQIQTLINAKGISYIQAEQEILGTDHAKLGGAIARFWEFPEELIVGIEQHHLADYAANPILDAVQIANGVAKLLGVGLGSEQMNLTINPDVPKRMELTSSSMETLCAMVQSKLAETLAQWEV